MLDLIAFFVFWPEVVALGGDNYSQRELAEARLVWWSTLSYKVVGVSKNSTDPERRRRIRRVLRAAVSNEYPPIAILSGKPLAEWCEGANYVGTISTSRPTGPEWRLGWLQPDKDTRCIPLRMLVYYYGERARTQCAWKDWHLDEDGRRATELLCKDLISLGVPLPVITAFLDYLKHREARLCLEQQTGR